MAIVKANYVKRGKGERGRAKATIRYITHRRDRDGHTVTRELFGYDGALTKAQTYRMIDEARRGTIFYRVMFQICTPAHICAILMPSRKGGQNGAHPRALSPLPK